VLSGAAPDVSIVVPAYRSERTLSRCLESLKAQTFNGRIEIIVVVSADDEAALPDERDEPGLTWLRRVPRLSAAEARNAGAALARGSALAFTDADVVVSRCWLAELIAVSQGRWCAAGSVATGTPHSLAGTIEYLVEFFDLTPARSGSPVHGATCNLLMPRSLWDGYGPFPEGMGGCEDTWITARLRSDGLFRFAAAAVVHHLNREQLGEVLVHQYQLGRAHARLAAHLGELPSAPVTAGIAATVARIRYFYRTVAAWTPHALPRALTLAPLILAGFSAWGLGLTRGLIALARANRSEDYT
jgi:glycosyltransferase involved in cell wall biosynthesis